MKIEEVKTVVVIGAGVMGKQIAMNTVLNGLSHGYKVILCSRSLSSAKKANQWARDYLSSRVVKGRITQEMSDKASERLMITQDTESAVKQADFIIESITENLEAKRELFSWISKMCRPDVILATNSSNIVSSRLADVTEYPERLLNMHYLNPALAMELVEIIRGEHTSEEALELSKDFLTCTGKTPIVIQKEIPGFVINRINAAVTHEACSLLEKGIASVEDIDLACEKGLHYPMGPFRLMDMVGIDVHYYIRCDRYAESHDEYDAPSAVVIEKFKKGEYGRKTGKGWYSYSDTDK